MSNKFIEVTLLYKGKRGKSDITLPVCMHVDDIIGISENESGTANIYSKNRLVASTEESYEQVLEKIKAVCGNDAIK